MALKEYQSYLLNMLLVFDAFCKEQGLEYFLAGGSALGAVRHGGFIPWDDDIDLAMLRPDFEKLEEILAEQGNKIGEYDYSPVIGQIVPDAPIGHLLYLPEGDYDKADAPKLDIHPVDGLPKAGWKRKVQRFFAVVHYMAVYRHPTKNKGKAAHFISKILVVTTSDGMFDRYARISRKVITAHDARRAAQVCSLFGLAGYANEVMDRELLVPYRRTEFEGHLLPVPCKEKEYLEKLYGDYEVLPPKEDREPKHDGYLRFVEAMKNVKGE
jgi:lipopolysaccharide cholinephosphotransferase